MINHKTMTELEQDIHMAKGTPDFEDVREYPEDDVYVDLGLVCVFTDEF